MPMGRHVSNENICTYLVTPYIHQGLLIVLARAWSGPGRAAELCFSIAMELEGPAVVLVAPANEGNITVW